MHLTNNALALILVNRPALEGQAWVDAAGDVPLAWLIAGAAMVAAGSLLVWVAGRRSGRR